MQDLERDSEETNGQMPQEGTTKFGECKIVRNSAVLRIFIGSTNILGVKVFSLFPVSMKWLHCFLSATYSGFDKSFRRASLSSKTWWD